MASNGGTVVPLLNLEPPHYDGVQALVVTNGSVGVDAELFSGSRDTCIKRWDLRNSELKQSMNNAHKGEISGVENCIITLSIMVRLGVGHDYLLGHPAVGLSRRSHPLVEL